jgi:hypothetical protein
MGEQQLIYVQYVAVLRIRIRIRKDPHNLAGSASGIF